MANDKNLTVKITGDAEDLEKELDAVKKRLTSLQGSFKKVAKISGAGFVATTGIIAATVKSFSKYETALLGVGKTTGLQGKALDEFGERFQQLSREIPVATNELLNIGQLAAQLGVEGSDNILNFADTIAKLARTTNLSSEDAAQSLAQLINITRNTIGDVDNLGASIVGLGNKFATTESQIVSVGTEVAKSSGIFGVSAEDSLALGAALAATGQRAEGAGSVIGRTFRAISNSISEGGDSIERLSRLTGIATDDLKKQFGDDAVGVFEKFAIGLGKVEASNVANTLAEFKLSGDEVLKVLPSLSQNVDLLSSALVLSRKEFAEASALNLEFAIQTKSLESEQTKLLNTISTISVQIGGTFKDSIGKGIKAIREFLEQFFDLDTNVKKSIGTILAWTAGVTGLVAIIATVGIGLTGLKIGFAGVAAAAATLKTGIILLGSAALTPIAGLIASIGLTAVVVYKNLDEMGFVVGTVLNGIKALGSFIKRDFLNQFASLKIGINAAIISFKELQRATLRVASGGKLFKEQLREVSREIFALKLANEKLTDSQSSSVKEFTGTFAENQKKLRDEYDKTIRRRKEGAENIRKFEELKEQERIAGLGKKEEEKQKKILKRAEDDKKKAAEDFVARKEQALAEAKEIAEALQEQRDERDLEKLEREEEEEQLKQEKKEEENEAILADDALVASYDITAKAKEIKRLQKQIQDLKKLKDNARTEEEKAQIQHQIDARTSQVADQKSELDLLKEKEMKKAEFDRNTKDAAISLAERFFSKIIGGQKAAALSSFSLKKALALKEMAINIPRAVIDSFANAGGYPTGILPAAMMAAKGAIQVAQVASQTLGLNQGGLVSGGSLQNKDSVPTMLTRGELVAPRSNFDEVIEGVIRQRGFVNPSDGGSKEGFTNNQTRVIIGFTDDAASVLTAQQLENSSLGTDRGV